MRVEYTCDTCGKTFQRRPKPGETYHHCSWECRAPADPVARFLRHVNQDTTSGCWLWLGGTHRSGHGQYQGAGAHRRSWELFRGSIPLGLCVCHHCDNPPCVNPDHLFLGTKQDNSQDMVTKGRNRTKRRLTPEQVAEIRARFGTCKQTELAQEYGVSSSMIRHIGRGRRWKDAA